MINITKHKNHKLYVPELARYTNLSEIKKLIQNDEKVCVTDPTGADITAHILAQVLTMTGKVPVGQLEQLIQRGE